MAAMTEFLLCIGVLTAWLGCLAFVRLQHALDRLHCATFVNVAGGASVTLAAFFQDGVTSRSLKILALFVAMLVMGAATSHAIGRALYLRDSEER